MTKKHLFSWLLKKAILMALWTKAILYVKSSLLEQSMPRTPSRPKTLCSLWLYSSCSLCLRGEKIREISVNPWLIKDLRACKALYICRDTFTDVMSALQIRPFMQNKANFRKSQMNVNKVLTRNYDNKTLGQRGKNKPNSNPIQTQFKPNTKPIKPKTNPKQTQCLPAISVADQSQKMKITGRHGPFAYSADLNVIDKTNCILSTNFVNISKYTRSNKMQLSEDCCPKFDEGAHICMEMK